MLDETSFGQPVSRAFGCWGQPQVPRKALQVFLGREVHSLQFRRPLFGIFGLPLEGGRWWGAHAWAGCQVGGGSAPGRHESGPEGDWLACWVEWGGYGLWCKWAWRRNGLRCATDLSRAEGGLYHGRGARGSPECGFEFWWEAGDPGLRFLCRNRRTIKSLAAGKGSSQPLGGGRTKPWMQASEPDEVARLRHRGGYRETDPKRHRGVWCTVSLASLVWSLEEGHRAKDCRNYQSTDSTWRTQGQNCFISLRRSWDGSARLQHPWRSGSWGCWKMW